MSEVSAGPSAGRPGQARAAEPPDGVAPSSGDDFADLGTVVEAIGRLWERRTADVPDWAAQELTFGQMRLLFLLGRHGATPMSRIAEWLGTGLPAASGTAERLERHGLVERRHRLDDRRVVDCQLTVAGLVLLEEIAGLQRDVLRRTLAVLEPAELGRLHAIIRTVLDRSESNLPELPGEGGRTNHPTEPGSEP